MPRIAPSVSPRRPSQTPLLRARPRPPAQSEPSGEEPAALRRLCARAAALRRLSCEGLLGEGGASDAAPAARGRGGKLAADRRGVATRLDG